MSYLRRIVTIFAAAACLFVAPAFSQTIHNNDYAVSQTRNNITATVAGKTVFSASEFAHAEFLVLRGQSGLVAGAPFTVTHKFTVVSLTGPYLSLRDDTDIEQGAIAAGGIRYWTIDLPATGTAYNFDAANQMAALPGTPGPIATLTAIIPAATLAGKLAQDPFISRLVHPATGQNPVAILNAAAGAAAGNPKLCFDAPADALTSFAFIAAGAGQIGIRLGLTGQSSCQDHLTVLGLAFPASAAITQAGAEMPLTMPGKNVTIISDGPPLLDDGPQFSPAK